MEYKAKNAYQDKIVVENYDNFRFKSIKGRVTNWLELRLVDRALRYTKILPPALVLDAPCGTGRLSLHLLKTGYTVTGVDISPEMVQYTKERLKKEDIDREIIVKVEDAEKLSFKDNSFDVCISLRLLGHTPPENRIKILKELSRVCNKYLILAYYDKESVKGILRKKKRITSNTLWYPVTISEIDLELKNFGLQKEGVYYLARRFSETIIIIARK
jgi:ubiquinone/menaquinone biosynthesis C-methylase UbiE